MMLIKCLLNALTFGVIVCTFSSPLEIVVVSPPNIAVDHKYHHPSVAVTAGSDVKLSCTWGGHIVAWEGSNSAILDFSKVDTNDVGMYTCCVRSGLKECSSIHFFVRERGSHRLSRSYGDPIVLPLLQNRPATIPCMPNSPDTHVSLQSAESWRNIWESGFGVTFDPTIGFSLKRATWTNEWVKMKCTSQDSSDTLDILIHWSVADHEILSLSVSEYPLPVRLGDSMRLSCQAVFIKGSPVQVFWLKEGRKLKSGGRITVIEMDTEAVKKTSILVVTNFQKSDAGSYSCNSQIEGDENSAFPAQERVVRFLDEKKVLSSTNIPMHIKNSNGILLFSRIADESVAEVGQNITLQAYDSGLADCKDVYYSWTKRGPSSSTGTRVSPRFRETHEGQNYFLSIPSVQYEDSGIYDLTVFACGSNGTKSFAVSVNDSLHRKLTSSHVTLAVYLTAIIITAVVMALAMGIFFFFLNRPHAHCQKDLHLLTNSHASSAMISQFSSSHNFSHTPPKSDYVPFYYKQPFKGHEIKIESLDFEGELIGRGAFGQVVKALYKSCPVAVKTMDNAKEQGMNFSEEIDILNYIGIHPYVVKMIGVVFRPKMMIVFEFCPYGNLVNFLPTVQFHNMNSEFGKRIANCLTTVSHCYDNVEGRVTTGPVIQVVDLFSYSMQISKAMEYLSLKKIIHRDVAARNVLVFSLHHVKLSDFGLSKNLTHDEKREYVTPGTKPLPYKWMAPESFIDKIFSTKSDVWSFGVLIWEIFELGKKQPYQPKNEPQQVSDFLESGGRLLQPLLAPDRLYHLMSQMWLKEAYRRPEFWEISRELRSMIAESSV